MEIRIVLHETEPPSAHLERVEADGGEPPDEAPFTGWLGLMRALESVIGQPPPRTWSWTAQLE
ncbi:MAG: hypothetical protein J2P22_08760 [Nocardioides sp.]|nr:hypothetical protein [Nocardioides sp.]